MRFSFSSDLGFPGAGWSPRGCIAALAVFCGGSAWAGHAGQAPLTGIELVPLDREAIAFGTFQSHNQKVVSTRQGIFTTHIRKANTNYTAQQWRLSRSIDGGNSFTTVLEDTHATSAPALEADQAGNLFLGRPDFLDGHAYLYRLDPSRPDAPPQVARLPGGAAGKYCLLLDEPRRQLYWFAHNNTFHVVGLDGTARTNVTLLAPGQRAHLQYPHLTLDADGTLFAAWTTSRPTGYLYHSVHALRSPDGGQTWQALDGRRLERPIVADDSGPATQISKDSECDVHTWLSAFLVKDAKLHFVYWAQTTPERQWYRRYDAATGRAEIEIENIFAQRPQQKVNDSGAFAARRTVAGATLYFVSTIDERKRLACLASDDKGRTWYEYALSDRTFPFRVYAVGTARDLTADGRIIGTFTDVVEKAGLYYEDNSGHVYFFRIQAGLCRARVRNFTFREGRARLDFDEIRGQPDLIRLGLADGTWSAWHPFAPRVTVRVKSNPQQYELKSRLDVLSPPQQLAK